MKIVTSNGHFKVRQKYILTSVLVENFEHNKNENYFKKFKKNKLWNVKKSITFAVAILFKK
jgi:hypothetical protein